MMCYSEYLNVPDVAGFEKVTTAFGVIPKECGLRPNRDQPVQLLKQRNGDGEFPWAFDLAGGLAEESDAFGDDESLSPIQRTLQRELYEEVAIRSGYFFPIGAPMREVRHNERKIVEYHLFRVIPFGPPRESEEAVNLVWANPSSVLALRIAGLDLSLKKMSPMAIMIYDGFSVFSRPFYDGPLTPEIKNVADSLLPKSYSLLDEGRYFGRLNDDGSVKIFKRLNPFEPSGCFKGSLDHLGR